MNSGENGLTRLSSSSSGGSSRFFSWILWFKFITSLYLGGEYDLSIALMLSLPLFLLMLTFKFNFFLFSLMTRTFCPLVSTLYSNRLESIYSSIACLWNSGLVTMLPCASWWLLNNSSVLILNLPITFSLSIFICDLLYELKYPLLSSSPSLYSLLLPYLLFDQLDTWTCCLLGLGLFPINIIFCLAWLWCEKKKKWPYPCFQVGWLPPSEENDKKKSTNWCILSVVCIYYYMYLIMYTMIW